MQITVTQVAKADDMSALEVLFKRGLAIADEGGNLAYLHRDIVAIQHARFVARGFGDGFADAPQRFGLPLIFSERGVDHKIFFHGLFKRTFQLRAQGFTGRGISELGEHVPRVRRGQRIARAG
jgi:hypothetical protein